MSRQRLLLLRHGQADSPPGVADRDRPLSVSGHTDSKRVGMAVSTRGLGPDYVVMSETLRTRETWSSFHRGLDGDPYVRTDARIYANTVDDLATVVRETPADAQTLLLVGHNPATAGLAGLLDPDPPVAEADRLRDGYPTATLTVFDVPAPWSELQLGSARLVDVIGPADLGAP